MIKILETHNGILADGHTQIIQDDTGKLHAQKLIHPDLGPITEETWSIKPEQYDRFKKPTLTNLISLMTVTFFDEVLLDVFLKKISTPITLPLIKKGSIKCPAALRWYNKKIHDNTLQETHTSPQKTTTFSPPKNIELLPFSLMGDYPFPLIDMGDNQHHTILSQNLRRKIHTLTLLKGTKPIDKYHYPLDAYYGRVLTFPHATTKKLRTSIILMYALRDYNMEQTDYVLHFMIKNAHLTLTTSLCLNRQKLYHITSEGTLIYGPDPTQLSQSELNL